MDQTYANTLRRYVTQPGSYSGSPGFDFALSTGMDNIGRQAAARGMNDSGNVLGDLLKFGVGTAQQDYGSTIDRLGRLSGQEEQYGLGETQAANSLALGHEANANTRSANDQQFGLGTYRAGNDYSLGMTNAGNARENNWWNYQLGGQANNNTAARDQNNYNVAQGQNGVNWFNANTNRGAQQSDAWLGDQRNQREWYSVYPRQRVAGGP